MTDLVLASMAALLGAASLAIVLLYRGWKRNRELINSLSAQIAAQQIAALTGAGIASSLVDEPPEEREPVRRRRHLALYIGGGAVAAFTVARDRLRSLWRSHRVLAITAAVTVATVTTAAALTMAATSNHTAEDRSHHPAASPLDDTDASTYGTPGRDAHDLRDPARGDKQGDSTLPTGGTVNLMTGGEEKRLDSEATPGPSTSGHTPADEADSGTGGETDGPSTPATGQPEELGPEEPGAPEPTKPAGPAALTVGTPQRVDADQRWCENVTVVIRNTGDTTATSGTLQFGTHIVGPLGIDWGTITQTRELPAPVPAGGLVEGHWTLCVDSWRVPTGWHIDTRDVSVTRN